MSGVSGLDCLTGPEAATENGAPREDLANAQWQKCWCLVSPEMLEDAVRSLNWIGVDTNKIERVGTVYRIDYEARGISGKTVILFSKNLLSATVRIEMAPI